MYRDLQVSRAWPRAGIKTMQVVLPDIETRATFELRAGRPMGDDEFFEFCARNPELRIERNAGGEIIIMPPAGFETGYRNNELCRQLGNWARADGRGVALDSNTEYLLPDGSALAPDASWVERSRLDRFTKEQKKRFLSLCPDFVVELTSPSDRLSNVRNKMQAWIDNGVQLGWLLDADVRTAYIYRQAQEPEVLRDTDLLLGEGPVAGFRLELYDICKGL
jgi:Uma2 family endonuclease